MSSFVRNIQRAAGRKYRKLGKGAGAHYLGRGRWLGTSRKPQVQPKAPRGSRRGTHKNPHRLAKAA